MRLILFFIAVTPVFAQFGAGLRLGARPGDMISTIGSRFSKIPHNRVFGPSVQLRLPGNLGVAFDLLHSNLEYRDGALVRSAGHWEFPLMVRKKFGDSRVKPFLAGGPSFSKITGLAVNNPAEFVKSSTKGVTFGAGLDIKALFLHIEPEFRFTHRLEDNFNLPNLIKSSRNSVMLMVGAGF